MTDTVTVATGGTYVGEDPCPVCGVSRIHRMEQDQTVGTFCGQVECERWLREEPWSGAAEVTRPSDLILCTGKTGGWRVGQAKCPWCSLPGDHKRRVLYVWIFGGYCGRDSICGHCGQTWSSDYDKLPNLSCEERDKNIERVRSAPDPMCWDCHDTGDLYPPAPEPVACGCARGQELVADGYFQEPKA